MTDLIKLDRTCLCTVVFLDIVGYSLESLEVQTQWKRRFNKYLADALEEAPEPERVILDTGDGAAICFLGNPEAAMFSALRLMGGVNGEKNREANPLRVRVGINLGSVKLVKDINGNPNAVGDGINMGQRVMSFAAENQILVSRSFFEVASSLSEGYAALFRYEGLRTDKHTREHTLYELHPPDAVHRASSGDTVVVRARSLLNPEQIARVENELTLMLGPISRHLVRNACRRAGSLAELRQGLLSLLPADANQEKFLEACRDIFSATTAASPSASSSEKPSPVLEPAVLERARNDLALYVGPMARVLVDRAAAQAPTRSALYEMLAGEIASARDREDFLKRACQP